ncbi:tail protein [Microbacterium phage KaiHaiDragon]|uniref:Minor tail protein n=1 Tax=Microbacterium phage KaiHaiDragon TaxID=2992931 RepID=A0A345MHX1_9CAUD|nr:tail protein [Microbacterium phage KaiHaiDragon]AXH70152.1 minor tail protein [Microbacterium phage KaiHaiDragon]UVG34515.1 minor tail protein [Microbacterium phage EarickHC]
MAIRSLEELLADLVSKVNRLERRLSRRGGPGGITGEMKVWGGVSAPSGWLLVQGQSLLIASYPDLYAVLGTRFGGNGTTTFNLPDLRGRVIVGQDTSQTEFDVLGEKSGAKTHTLAQSEIPAHTHGAGNAADGFIAHLTALDGSQSARWNTFSSGQGNEVGTYRQPMVNTPNGGAHNNLQPYIVLHHIIKV